MYPLYKATIVGFSGRLHRAKKENMAFGIIRARNLSAGDIASTDKHNARQYNSVEEYPENIQPEGKKYTRYLKDGREDFSLKESGSLKKAIESRLEKNNVKGIRKNSNYAIEYVCTVNEKKAWENYAFGGFVSNTMRWLEDRHGNDSVVATYEHLDESNPHVHFIVVPLQTKEVRWKNSRGEGTRTETRLNTREYTGGRKKLSKLQDDYFEHLMARYNGGEKMGVKFFRGTKVEQQHKEYSQKTDHKIGELRTQLEKTEEPLQKEILELQIRLKQVEKAKADKEFLDKQNRHQEKNRKNWDRKGTRDNKDIFHSEKEKPKQQSGIKR